MREGRRRLEYQKQQKHYHRHEAKKSADTDPRRHTTSPVMSSGGYSDRNSNPSISQSQQQLPAAVRYHPHQQVPSVGCSPRSSPAGLNRVKPPPMAACSTPPLAAAARLPTSSPMCNTPNSSGSRNSYDMKEESKNIQIATQLFYNHDVKNKGRLTAEELQKLLQNDDCTHFCISAIDSLINLFGATRFGTINQSEFVSLYKRVKYWRKVYVDNDINGSYTISVSEYHNSLQELGYLIPFEVSERIFDQYAEFINHNFNGKELKFDKFVESLVWLMRLTKCFRKFDENQEGTATIHYKDFIDATLYLGRFLPH
ncbi:related to Peflin [Zygosaccharomyces bailii]|nr:related to Peflin [Zygosaccharomyces bailii]